MGLSSIGPGSIILIILLVLLLFGTKRLRNIGKDAANAIKEFKSSMKEEDSK